MPYCHTGAEAVYVSFRTIWSAIHSTADIQAQAWEVRRPTRNEDPIPSHEIRLSGQSGLEIQRADVSISVNELSSPPVGNTNRCAMSSAMARHSGTCPFIATARAV